MECTILATPDGRFEIKPGASGRLVFHDARLEYTLVPSLVGTDFVYSAKADAASDRLYLPSLGMLVGLVAGEDSVFVGVWRPGKQVVSLHRGPSQGKPTFDGLTLDTAGEKLLCRLDRTRQTVARRAAGADLPGEVYADRLAAPV